MTSLSAPLPERFQVSAADGFALAAHRFTAVGERLGRIVIAGATATPQGFYRRFARYTATRGFETFTLDYRGVGLSRPPSLAGFDASLLDWARLDLAALFEAIPDDGVPLFMVGHSFGGHAFGLLPHPQRVSRVYLFGTGAGWHGWMPLTERWRVLLLWHVLGPVLVRWKGYAPFSKVGLGVDLPLGVYRNWKRWCGFPRYFLDDPELPDLAAELARVRTPIVAANALDDRWAPPASRDAFLAGYVNAPIERVDLERPEGAAPIGHVGYFREDASPLWDAPLEWFKGA